MGAQRLCAVMSAMAMLFSAAVIMRGDVGRGDAIFGRGPNTYSRNPIDCRDAIFSRGDAIFGHGPSTYSTIGRSGKLGWN